MRYLSALLIIFVLWLFSTSATPARAQVETPDCDGLAAIDWREERTQAFAFLFPAEEEGFGRAFSQQFGESLDAEYARYEALFETSLTLPITVRLYPTAHDYTCLNAQPPQISSSATHSHIGAREIALIWENIAPNRWEWLRSYENIFRYELGVLFAEHVSGGRALPGLLVSVGHFTQDPAETIGLLRNSGDASQDPVQSWRTLWEEAGNQPEFSQRIQATSTVAYLVDVFGWTPFLHFLQSLQTSASYRQSLTQAFGKDFAELEAQWQEYFPHYLRYRWQTHIFYNYDLSPFQRLIEEEKYSDAQKGLEGVIPFLEKINQVEKLNQARSMLEKARQGQEAEALVLQSRQALQNGEYQRSIDLVNQAEAIYTRIGNFFHLDMMNAYRYQAQKILQLHEELERLRPLVGTHWNTLTLAARVVSLGQQLSTLGDIQGHAQVRELAQVVQTRQRSQQIYLSLAILLVVLILLAARILLLRRQPSVEAQL